MRTRSPTATPMGRRLPFLSREPGPTARTLASLSSLTAVSGRKMPVAVLASGLMRWTRMRSRRGAMLRMDLIADYEEDWSAWSCACMCMCKACSGVKVVVMLDARMDCMRDALEHS